MASANIQQRIQKRENVKLLQKEVEAINLSADNAVRESEATSTELVNLMQRSFDVTQQIKSWQKYEVSRVKEIQEMPQKEKLSETDDQIKSLLAYPSPSNLVRLFDDVAAAVSKARGEVLESFKKEMKKISETLTKVEVESFPDPKTKADFSQYAAPKDLLKLDPNTASMTIQLSEDNTKATSKPYHTHADRFMGKSQVLCGKGLTDRCYWEVEWSGLGGSVAVAYRDVPRTEKKSAFGKNDKSWALEFSTTYCNFKHNSEKKTIPVPQSKRIGVFLDQKAGVLSFYSVSETITLLHRVHTTFTQPLYAGLGVYFNGSSATFCDIKVEPLSSEVREN